MSFSSPSRSPMMRTLTPSRCRLARSLRMKRRSRPNRSPISLAGVTTPVYDFGEPRTLDSFSQEFRYVSDYDGPFNFVGGVFFYYANESRDLNGIAQWEENTAGGFFQSATLCPEHNFALYPDTVDPQCVALRPELFEPSFFRVFQRTKTTSISGLSLIHI